MISVIVPVLNSGRYLKTVVHSLLGQNYPSDSYELIFVDNGSTDDSMQILQRFPEIRVFTEPVQGSYAARNLGVSKARGDIFAFTDSDCYPGPDWLQAIEQSISKDDIHIVLGPRQAKASYGGASMISEYENNKAEFMCRSDDPIVYYGYTNNMAVKRKSMDRFGPFVDRRRGSDTIFVRRVVEALSTNAVTYNPAMVVRHAEMNSTVTYYRKMVTYGKVRRNHRHQMKARSLTNAERISVYWRTVDGKPFFQSIHLLLLLGIGIVAWWLGGLLAHERG